LTGVSANTATTDISKVDDKIFNFENVSGGSNGDYIFATDGANVIKGNDGGDRLFGFGGNDLLEGGEGADWLIGGAGKDTLTGGAGPDSDRFAFSDILDSGITAASRDVITDFEDGVDKIHLAQLDANKNNPGIDDFNYIGSNVQFTGVAGQLRSYWSQAGHIIEGDVNADGKADFSIAINDKLHNITLDATDFVL
jgi:serralysin